MPSPLQQLPAEATPFSSGQLAGGSLNPARMNLNAAPSPDVSVLSTGSSLGPVDEREALHAGVLELSSTTMAQGTMERNAARSTGRDQDAVKSMKPQVSFI